MTPRTPRYRPAGVEQHGGRTVYLVEDLTERTMIRVYRRKNKLCRFDHGDTLITESGIKDAVKTMEAQAAA